MSGWNFADVFDVVAAQVPNSPAVIQGDRVLRWNVYVHRSRSLAESLLDAHLPEESTLAIYLRNSPEYLEALAASFYAALPSFNTNYRYTSAEILDLWRDARPGAVVFHLEFAPVIEEILDDLDFVGLWVCVHESGQSPPEWARSFESLVAYDRSLDAVEAVTRSGDDLLLLYTGGTTGRPKGVMWRQDDLFVLLGNAARAGYPDQPDLAFAASRVSEIGRRHLPAAPLMHGAGSLTCLPVLSRGGAIVLLEGPGFDPEELLDVVDRHGVNTLTWVGDAFAKPVLVALEANPSRWSLESLDVITSGGTMFSEAVKEGLLAHAPHLKLVDVFGSSEALSAAKSVRSKDTVGRPQSTTFRPREGVVLIGEDGRSIPPGTGEAGLLGFGGRIPVGYYRDPVATAKAFRVIDGSRYSVPGDYGTVAEDGTVTVLGRGSSCINTGGEKVFPEEVEAALAEDPRVRDSAVVGIPHERFGEQVVALVQLADGEVASEAELIEVVRERLAAYKAPRTVIFVDEVERGPNGKINHSQMRSSALELIAVESV